MEHEYKITFSYWREKKCRFFEIIDIEDSIQKVECTKVIKAKTQENAKQKLQNFWRIPIKILSIKEQNNERERER